MRIIAHTFPREQKRWYAVKLTNQNLLIDIEIENLLIFIKDGLPGATKASDNQLIKWKILNKIEKMHCLPDEMLHCEHFQRSRSEEISDHSENYSW